MPVPGGPILLCFQLPQAMPSEKCAGLRTCMARTSHPFLPEWLFALAGYLPEGMAIRTTKTWSNCCKLIPYLLCAGWLGQPLVMPIVQVPSCFSSPKHDSPRRSGPQKVWGPGLFSGILSFWAKPLYCVSHDSGTRDWAASRQGMGGRHCCLKIFKICSNTPNTR